ncbi:MAG: adenylosuccinate lyase [Omnitrophica WOR_2 bacterium GWF2_43_52]|nr:MAG: adenylosuccinate lyase [Omnitrophica WOR_2 bacterium GWA2_44_7]OGX14202.1 MAG: adenylosuccinate lyase [Omnitrophica WOR_2 bacterium GWC2_44_8]OGX22735.1 MAG: adenylosuccinate lyase [Omnitrophica WOR_2 bacterium GWF2_43_52]HAH20256.1 adenylosuccinate lyase [Candidatus Omnitrophota bacterium]HBG63340.1 adenylosuccinate lyase [Candidatus Omnitrophota bacterium]
MIARYSLPKMSAIWQDESKFSKFLEIEVLTCEAYAHFGKIPADAAKKIRAKAAFNAKRINALEEKTQHDVVAFVNCVGESLGPYAKYLHMGLTSSDLLDTTLSLQAHEACEILIEDTQKLLTVLARKARCYKDMVCIGRTHGIHAEPTTFGLKLALMYDETKRNLGRLQWEKEAVSVGKLSGAVGTYSNIDPRIEAYVCRKLKLRPAQVSTQIISRDIYAEFINVLALVGSSLEKFATEIRHLQRTEVLEVEEPFGKGQKGSSAMPHKRNPVICERICGLARILRANALVALENVNLWHERDISHSSAERVIFPDSTIALDYMITKFTEVIDGLVVYPENMLENVIRTKGLIFSQRLLLALMDKGLPRSQAYDLVQQQAMKSWKERLDFKRLVTENGDIANYLSSKEIESCFSINYYLRNINTIFRRLGI